jgi:hypothetical protein
VQSDRDDQDGGNYGNDCDQMTQVEFRLSHRGFHSPGRARLPGQPRASVRHRLLLLRNVLELD